MSGDDPFPITASACPACGRVRVDDGGGRPMDRGWCTGCGLEVGLCSCVREAMG